MLVTICVDQSPIVIAFHEPTVVRLARRPSPPPLSPMGRGDYFPSPALREGGGGGVAYGHEGGHRFKPMRFMVREQYRPRRYRQLATVLMFVGSFGPSLAAVILVARNNGRAGLRIWLSRRLQWHAVESYRDKERPFVVKYIALRLNGCILLHSERIERP